MIARDLYNTKKHWDSFESLNTAGEAEGSRDRCRNLVTVGMKGDGNGRVGGEGGQQGATPGQAPGPAGAEPGSLGGGVGERSTMRCREGGAKLGIQQGAGDQVGTARDRQVKGRRGASDGRPQLALKDIIFTLDFRHAGTPPPPALRFFCQSPPSFCYSFMA